MTAFSSAAGPTAVSTVLCSMVPAAPLLRRFAQHLARPAARRSAVSLIALAVVLATLPYAPNAEARGGHHRAGFFMGGVVLGAVLAPRYVYSAPYYYPPPVYYAPYPPQVTYVQPPVVVQQVAPAPAPQAVPVQPAAAPQTLGIEERLRRLRSMCEQGLFTAGECQTRREQLLQEM